jgi:signal transduction histidine kinase/CheY-like chemotaxis protein
VIVADQDLHVAEPAPASYAGAARNARKAVLARFGRVEKLLLGVYLPAYLVALGLHAYEVERSGLAQLPVFVRAVPGDYPVVAGHPVETDSSGSGLEPGDRLIRLAERDLSGVGYVGFQAIGLARTPPGHPAPLVFERRGERRSVAIEARPHVHPWSRLPLLLLIPTVCVLVLLRAPSSAGARRLFVAALTYGFAQAEFYGGPEWKTWLAAVSLNVAGPLAIGTVLHWARRFPDEMPEAARIWAGAPWLAALLYLVLVRGSYLFGGPVPSLWIPRVSLASHAAAIFAAAAILIWNYAHAFAAGRRRLRWVLLGTLLGSLPFVAALLAPLVAPGWQGVEQAFALGFLGTVIWVSGFVLAVVRDNAFDVDRLLGATATWSLAAGAAIVALAVLVPAAAGALAGYLDIDPLGVSFGFAVLLGALAVPLATRLRPRIDRLLFPERETLREGTERLLEDLVQCRSDDELLALACERSAQLIGARGFALYRAGSEGFRCSQAAGLALPQRLSGVGALPQQLAPGNGPPQLAAHGVGLVLPIRLDARLDAFLCLGAKRSGDIYTRTDTDALAAVAARVEATRARLAKEQADRESRAKTNLIAAASHDLRQPLHAVSLLAEALAARLGDPEARELVGRIGASTHDLDEMLTSLLDRSKLDTDAVRAELGRVELRALFAQLERDFAGPAEAKGLRLRVVPTRLAVESDRLLLLRILRNLVSNAVRYTPTGAVLIGARPRGAEVAIEVRDGGPGIPEQAQGEIFEAFHQLPGSRGGGLGLGLSIVHDLARVLGHRVELRSAPGRGSTFAVHATRVAPAPALAPTADSASPAPLAARRVLVVDDDDAVRHATRELLTSWGCEVREAASTADALLAAAGWTPDLVLADYRLGAGPPGTELVACLRAAAGTDLAAVIVTGESEGPGLASIRAAGLSVLRKPVRPARLRALLAARPSSS